MISKVIISCLFWLFISPALAYSNPGIKNPYVSKQYKFVRFDSIQAADNIDLQINAGCCRHTVAICGRLSDVSSIKAYVRGSTLWIGRVAQNCTYCRPKIQINMPYLKQVVYRSGRGSIDINASPNYPLCLDIQGSPKVHLYGNILPGRFLIGGQTQLSVYWINARDFYLKASDRAKICLAGRVGTFAADVLQSAWVNARYLRTDRVFVKSYNCSRVDLRSSCALNVLASQRSAIYYYETPYFQAPFMAGAGAVVPMTHICYPACTDCDMACCKNGWH